MENCQQHKQLTLNTLFMLWQKVAQNFCQSKNSKEHKYIKWEFGMAEGSAFLQIFFPMNDWDTQSTLIHNLCSKCTNFFTTLHCKIRKRWMHQFFTICWQLVSSWCVLLMLYLPWLDICGRTTSAQNLVCYCFRLLWSVFVFEKNC